MDLDWNVLLVNQLGWHWEYQLRPRLNRLATGARGRRDLRRPRRRPLRRPPVAWDSFDYAGSAGAALAQLDAGYAAWS
jgi:hypothetical protein